MRSRAIGLAALALSLAASSAALAAPVLQGPPPRPLTAPRAITAPRLADARPVPIPDLFFVRGGMDASWTRDGKAVVFSTNLTGRYNLWTVPAAGGFPLQLTQSDDRQSGIATTGTGQVVYESDKAGAEIYDLYATPQGGGETVNLTDTADVDETGAIVSPDGRSIAFSQRPEKEPSNNIAVMDLATRTVRQLTHEASPDRSWSLAGWSADGRTLAATRADATRTHAAVYLIDVASGRADALTQEAAGIIYATALSPDGRQVAVTFENAQGAPQAGLLDVATRKITPLKPDAWEQESGTFSPDGRTLLFSSNVDGRNALLAYDRVSGRSRQLPIPDGVNREASASNASFSPDGSRLLVTHQAGSTPFDFWVVDLRANTARPLTRLGLASIDTERLPRAQVVHYKSADGTVISALLWMPANLARDGKAAAVVLPHGGPTGQTMDNFNKTAIALASRGYVALAPNPRGSTGYGRAFQDANKRDLGGGDLEDEVAGAKFLVDTGYIDAKRVGITGGSYGGYMTLMAVAKTPQVWAAGVEQYGIIDWASMYRSEAPTLQQYQIGLIGDPDKDADVYKASSPMTYIAQVRAPLLVLQGDNDIRVPKNQAEQVIAVLQKNGRTVDSHFYSNEGHGFAKRENQIDALQRTVAWFDKYLKPAS